MITRLSGPHMISLHLHIFSCSFTYSILLVTFLGSHEPIFILFLRKDLIELRLASNSLCTLGWP